MPGRHANLRSALGQTPEARYLQPLEPAWQWVGFLVEEITPKAYKCHVASLLAMTKLGWNDNGCVCCVGAGFQPARFRGEPLDGSGTRPYEDGRSLSRVIFVPLVASWYTFSTDSRGDRAF